MNSNSKHVIFHHIYNLGLKIKAKQDISEERGTSVVLRVFLVLRVFFGVLRDASIFEKIDLPTLKPRQHRKSFQRFEKFISKVD